MKHQPKSNKHRDKRHNLSWETLMGKKTQQLLQYRFNSQAYNANTMIFQCQDQTLVPNPSHKEGYPRICQTLAKIGSKDVHDL